MITTDVPAQIRRRRAASYRCPALADGRRDTLDKAKPRTPTTVRALAAGTDEFDGPGVYAGIQTLGIRYMRARHGRGWWIPAKHTGDLTALLESRGFTVQAVL